MSYTENAADLAKTAVNNNWQWRQ